MASTQMQSLTETGTLDELQEEEIESQDDEVGQFREESSASPAHHEIAALAYSYWQSQGCPDGCDVENWLKAEATLRNGASGNHYDSHDKS
jgi:DUF2934 family protein